MSKLKSPADYKREQYGMWTVHSWPFLFSNCALSFKPHRYPIQKNFNPSNQMLSLNTAMKLIKKHLGAEERTREPEVGFPSFAIIRSSWCELFTPSIKSVFILLQWYNHKRPHFSSLYQAAIFPHSTSCRAQGQKNPYSDIYTTANGFSSLTLELPLLHTGVSVQMPRQERKGR